MKLKGLSQKELEILESKLAHDIAQAEKTTNTQKTQLKKLKHDACQVRARLRQTEYKERLRYEFLNLQIQ